MFQRKGNPSGNRKIGGCLKGGKEMKTAASLFGLCALITIISYIIAPTQALAQSPINKNWKGLAIKGYDPVAYFTDGKPIEGKKEFEYTWQDAKWRFANKDHLNLFKSDPEKYAPQYGGY
jgi:YHS domain-containing protein